MCPPNIVFWCFVLLIFASKSQRNFTNNNKRSNNSTVRYDPLVNSVKYRNNGMESMQCDSCENSIKNNEVQYEFHVNSTKNDRKNNDLVQYESREHIIKIREQSNQMSIEVHANSTEINILQDINGNFTKTEDENVSMLNEFYGNSNTDKYNNITTTIVPYEACTNITCIQLCCPFGNELTARGMCVVGQGIYKFPSVPYGNDSEDKKLNELLPLTIHDPCVSQGFGRRLLPPNIYGIHVNGTLYTLFKPNDFLLPMFYCLAVLNRKIYDVIVCTNKTKMPVYISACLLISLPFLLLTFVVYSILPELQNIHSYTLRAYIASLFITYLIMYFGQQVPEILVEWRYCVPLAYIFNFSFLSSFFWLNVTCFDIWWTFRRLHSYQSNVKQDKKKFVMYLIYAWGITFILNIICAIMDYAPEIPKNLIRPEMCTKKFWFSENEAKMLYFYVPMGITIISNICFFIASTLTILYRNIYTAHQLRDSESQRHNENKQRFYMYLKLFIMMGITWVMELISWSISVDLVSEVFWYPAYIINGLQGVIIFIVFVCRKKIKELLLKRFNGCGLFCKILTNNDSTTINTTSTSGSGTGSGTLHMQEINSSN